MTRPDGPALHRLLAGTADTLTQVVGQGRSLTDALAQVPANLRPGIQDLSFHGLRHWGTARALRQHLVPQEPNAAGFAALIDVAISLLLPAAELPGAPRYAAFTVVDQAVKATQARPHWRRFKGLTNAVLRRYLRESEPLLQQVSEQVEARWNHPEWWVARLQSQYPEHWQQVLGAAQTPAPLCIRVNPRRSTRAAVQAALAEQDVASTPVHEHGLVLERARPVHQLPGFADGWWSVQDPGAQLAAPLLEPRDGMRVLDACAAPGGKTAHLLELAELDLTAIDRDAARLHRVNDNLARLGLQARVLAGDAAHPETWFDGQPFDAILADVPCTASGIVRRHPDIRWLRRRTDIAATAALQQHITDALWPLLRRGGTFLYVTCSVFAEEGEHQAQAFVARHPNAERVTAPGQLLPACPEAPAHQQHDGFFFARFRKS